MHISVDGGEPRILPMRSVLVANCGRLQGGIRLADMTDVHDGKLEVIVASPRDLVEWGLLMAKVMRRTILGSPRIDLPVIRHLVGSEWMATRRRRRTALARGCCLPPWRWRSTPRCFSGCGLLARTRFEESPRWVTYSQEC